MANLVDTYDYTDGSGQLLFQVCRFDDKSFKQRRKGSNGSWIWGLEDTPRVLYKLPQIIGKEFVFFVEGEKDVHTVEKLGLPATTNPMGSKKVPGQQKKYDILAPLQDKRVYILPDNDEPGKIQAEQVGTLLIELGIPSEVKILNLPLENPGEDITDLCERLGNEKTIELLKRLVKSTDRFALKQLSLNKLDRIHIKDSARAINCNDRARDACDKACDTIVTPVTFAKGNRDDDIFRLANHLVKGGMKSELVEIYCNFFGTHCVPPFSEKEVELKIKSALNRKNSSDRNITQEIREWVVVTSGDFSVTSLYQDVTCVTKTEKAAVRQALRRLVDEKIIERVGKKNGIYRKVDTSLIRIDLSDTSDLVGELHIKIPMGVHDFVRIMPGTINVIAGEPDSGKSAYLMNLAMKNTKRFPVHYFSSEMGKAEFIDRLQYFWPNAATDPNMLFYERYDDFHDVIFENDINIIDYVKIFDDFFRMAEIIEKIGRKLKKGVAFISMQKPRGRDDAVGGERTRDLARLYLAMSPGLIKIIKAKNWRNSMINPNGLERHFKLRDGCFFHPQGEWIK